MSEKLTIGFWAGIDYSDPRFTAAAALAITAYETMSFGGPRKRERVLAEIEACERTLEGLRAELAGLPESENEHHG